MAAAADDPTDPLMSSVIFKDDGSAARVAASIERMAAKTADPLPVLNESRTILAENEAAAFESSGGTIGEAWQALSPTTVAQKGNDRVLVMTGRLRDALSDPANVHVEATGAALNASSVPYAHFHITGTSKMPARPFMGISPATQRALSELMSRYMAADE